MNTARPQAFTNDALTTIRSRLELSESAKDFLAGMDAIIADPDNLLTLPVDLGTPDELIPGETDEGIDAENGPKVYEFLGALDPSNASDPRLWTYLAFGTYRDYMERRWPLEGVRNWKGRVKDRWLMANPARGILIRHGIARLWWVTSITYDPHREHPLSKESGDPFAYAKAVFRNEDRVIALFDREAGSLRSLTRAVLEHAVAGSTQMTGGEIKTLMKEVRLTYGFRDLDVLDSKQISELISTLGRARNEPSPPAPKSQHPLPH